MKKDDKIICLNGLPSCNIGVLLVIIPCKAINKEIQEQGKFICKYNLNYLLHFPAATLSRSDAGRCTLSNMVWSNAGQVAHRPLQK
jgi:hypothetical protein